MIKNEYRIEVYVDGGWQVLHSTTTTNRQAAHETADALRAEAPDADLRVTTRTFREVQAQDV